MIPIDALIPYANNAKKHTTKQLRRIQASLREFGFVAPVIVDEENNIVAGHGRVEAARAEGMTQVPCVLAGSLTQAQRKAYILADNRLSEMAEWDPEILKIELEGLKALEFDMDFVGFESLEDALGGEITDGELEDLMADEVAARSKALHRVVVECRDEAEACAVKKVLVDAGYCPKVTNR